MPIRRKRNDVGYSRWPLTFPIERPYLRVIYDTHNTPFIFGVSLPDYIPYLKRSFPHFRTITSITALRDAENHHSFTVGNPTDYGNSFANLICWKVQAPPTIYSDSGLRIS